MVTLLIIFQYFVQSSVDIMDKFLITARKIEPVSYTFYTIVTGVVLVVIWPFVYHSLPFSAIIFDIFCGSWFSLGLFVFFRAVSEGEISRVVPFVFGLVPVFDILFGLINRHNSLRINEIAAMFLLIPGALLISYKHPNFVGKHVMIKLSAAILISSYNVLWHISSQSGPFLNGLIWNRLGAVGILVLLLLIPAYRKKVFTVKHVEKKKSTSWLFLLKQTVGGSNFYLLSFLYKIGKVPVIDALQGFRYVFLFLAVIFLSGKYNQVVSEHLTKRIIQLKIAALVLISLGTILLFI